MIDNDYSHHYYVCAPLSDVTLETGATGNAFWQIKNTDELPIIHNFRSNKTFASSTHTKWPDREFTSSELKDIKTKFQQYLAAENIALDIVAIEEIPDGNYDVIPFDSQFSIFSYNNKRFLFNKEYVNNRLKNYRGFSGGEPTPNFLAFDEFVLEYDDDKDHFGRPASPYYIRGKIYEVGGNLTESNYKAGTIAFDNIKGYTPLTSKQIASFTREVENSPFKTKPLAKKPSTPAPTKHTGFHKDALKAFYQSQQNLDFLKHIALYRDDADALFDIIKEDYLAKAEYSGGVYTKTMALADFQKLCLNVRGIDNNAPFKDDDDSNNTPLKANNDCVKRAAMAQLYKTCAKDIPAKCYSIYDAKFLYPQLDYTSQINMIESYAKLYQGKHKHQLPNDELASFLRIIANTSKYSLEAYAAAQNSDKLLPFNEAIDKIDDQYLLTAIAKLADNYVGRDYTNYLKHTLSKITAPNCIADLASNGLDEAIYVVYRNLNGFSDYIPKDDDNFGTYKIASIGDTSICKYYNNDNKADNVFFTIKKTGATYQVGDINQLTPKELQAFLIDALSTKEENKSFDNFLINKLLPTPELLIECVDIKENRYSDDSLITKIADALNDENVYLKVVLSENDKIHEYAYYKLKNVDSKLIAALHTDSTRIIDDALESIANTQNANEYLGKIISDAKSDYAKVNAQVYLTALYQPTKMGIKEMLGTAIKSGKQPDTPPQNATQGDKTANNILGRIFSKN
jgi:hypothetical protein